MRCLVSGRRTCTARFSPFSRRDSYSPPLPRPPLRSALPRERAPPPHHRQPHPLLRCRSRRPLLLLLPHGTPARPGRRCAAGTLIPGCSSLRSHRQRPQPPHPLRCLSRHPPLPRPLRSSTACSGRRCMAGMLVLGRSGRRRGGRGNHHHRPSNPLRCRSRRPLQLPHGTPARPGRRCAAGMLILGRSGPRRGGRRCHRPRRLDRRSPPLHGSPAPSGSRSDAYAVILGRASLRRMEHHQRPPPPHAPLHRLSRRLPLQLLPCSTPARPCRCCAAEMLILARSRPWRGGGKHPSSPIFQRPPIVPLHPLSRGDMPPLHQSQLSRAGGGRSRRHHHHADSARR